MEMWRERPNGWVYLDNLTGEELVVGQPVSLNESRDAALKCLQGMRIEALAIEASPPGGKTRFVVLPEDYFEQFGPPG